jgi:adenylate cyclase
MAERNAPVAASDRIEFRIGINLGDVIVEEHDIFGDGVNVAARLEALAEPGRICVSRVVRDQVRDKLPTVFEDLGEQQVKNIARPVRVYRVRDTSAETPRVVSALPLPDKPSVAVLPFANMSGDPEQEYFADGMVEEIVTALSRIRWLFVIARNSTFTYKGQAVDVKQVGRELGVRYVLEGSVRKAVGRVRITAQLVDATNGAHLWADRFDGSLEDVFDLQDKVAISVAGVLEPTLQAAEIRRSTDQPTKDLTAYDLYLRALPHFVAHDRDGMIKTLDLLREAIERDPRYGPALALAAICRADLQLAGWTNDPEVNRRDGIELARRALGAAADDPAVLGRAAYALGCLGEDIAAAVALSDRSLELNPSFAGGWVNSGWLRLWAGQPDIAIEHFRTGLRLNPRAHHAGAFLGIGVGHFLARRFDEAEAMLLRSLQVMPAWAGPYRWLASCYAQMGRLDEAQQMVQRLRVITPLVSSPLVFRNREHRELYLSGLRLAAGEPT